MILGNVQKVIAIIFFIILILIYIAVFWTFSQAGQNSYWPPTIQTCPDYWKDMGGTACYNVLNTGKGCSGAYVNFNGVDNCNRYKWSIGDTGASGISQPTCGNVPWDGINYGYGEYNPCNENYNPQTL